MGMVKKKKMYTMRVWFQNILILITPIDVERSGFLVQLAQPNWKRGQINLFHNKDPFDGKVFPTSDEAMWTTINGIKNGEIK